MRCPGLMAVLFLLSEFQRMMSSTFTWYLREMAIKVSPLLTVCVVVFVVVVFMEWVLLLLDFWVDAATLVSLAGLNVWLMRLLCAEESVVLLVLRA